MSNIYEQMRCETCGGELKYSEDRKSAVCLNCGNEYHFKEEKSENLAMMLNLANKARLANDFDGAIQKYEAVIEENPTDAEAHWGLVLSTYGIEYVEDPRTHERIPTCRRTVKQSIIENKDYLAAIENAAPDQREVYEVRAKLIDKLQTKIKAQLESEEDFDVFISFKATDNNGYPTKDSIVARTIYDELEKRGIKTFFSEVTLKHRLGEDYEPIIYKALYSCKFFILVATSEENINSAWVKNEWSRFRDRVIDEAMAKAGCAVFENLGLNELPPFLRGQGIPLEKYPNGGYEIIIADSLADRFGLTNKNQEAEEIKKQIEEQKRSTQELEEKLKMVSSSQTTSGGVSVASLLMRGDQELAVRDFEKAAEYYHKVTDMDPTNGEAFWKLFLCDLKAKTPAEAAKKIDRRDLPSISQDKNLLYACKYADDKIKKQIAVYVDKISSNIQERIEQGEDAYQKNQEESKAIDLEIEQQKNQIDVICADAKRKQRYNPDLFKKAKERYSSNITDFKSYNYRAYYKPTEKIKWGDDCDNSVKMIGYGFYVGCGAAALAFVLGMISIANTGFLPILERWIASWFLGGLTVPLVIGVAAWVLFMILYAICKKRKIKAINRKNERADKKRYDAVTEYNEMVDMASQVIGVNEKLYELESRKKGNQENARKCLLAIQADKTFLENLLKKTKKIQTGDKTDAL